ncbi:MAG: HD domain-containing protein, partial [bacterium]|nr:HD domain-containing protein [bacterium]
SVLRHSWTDDAHRQESVADHSWHMAIVAIALAPDLQTKVDLLRVFELIAVHDLGEMFTGDIPAFAARAGKYEAEKEAVAKITQTLPTERQKEIFDLWQEYEERQTKEALFVKMLDVIDVINQHLAADISTWSKEEWTFNLNRDSEKYFKDEPLMLALYNFIHDELEKKVARR